MQIGDINIPNEIIDLHYQLKRMSFLLDRVLSRMGASLQPSDLTAADSAAMSFVQNKFPNMGIQKK